MLFIVTPVSRPENLNRIYDSIFMDLPLSKRKHILWVLLPDNSKIDYFNEVIKDNSHFQNTVILESKISNSMGGYSLRNYFFESYFETTPFFKNYTNYQNYVQFLDDDTIMHAKYYDLFFENKSKDKTALIFSQIDKNFQLRLAANYNSIKVCQIDMGQYTLNLNRLPKKFRFDENEYTADGIFIEKLYKKLGPDEFTVVNQVGSIYNYLNELK